MLSPRFRLFSRKTDSKVESESDDQQPPSKISISNAISLLHAIELQNTQELCSRLSHTRDTVLRSIRTIEKLANELEIEKIKVEETRFEAIVENSKRIVVSSLRRECTVEMPEPSSHSDAIKFSQRLEAATSRFREVSTSHNRVFNVFIKKYAGKLKDEFESLSSLSKEVNLILDEFDTQQRPLLDCMNLLKMLSEGNISIGAKRQRLQDIRTELGLFESKLKELKLRMLNVENSAEFHEYSRVNNEIRDLENKKLEIQRELVHLFSPISRALTKYSYGISKQTSERLSALSHEPWVILEQDFGPYLDILIDIQRDLSTERIQLKDAPKVFRHLDNLLKSLPSIREKYQTFQHHLISLYQQSDASFDSESLKLKENISQTSRNIEEKNNESIQLENHLEEKQLQLHQFRLESEACLFKILGKKYNLLT